MAKSDPPEALVVLESFVGSVKKGEEHMYRQGDLVRADDPAIKKWPHLFGPAKYRTIEQATAAPGETR